MTQAVLHNYPNAEVEWEFRCRNSEDLTPYLAGIRYQIERLAEVSITQDQLAYLEKIPFIKPDYIRFLGLFRFNLRYVQVAIDDARQLPIKLRGPWLHVILYEIPLLAIVSEVRYRYRDVVIEQVGARSMKNSIGSRAKRLPASRLPVGGFRYPATFLIPGSGRSGPHPQARLPRPIGRHQQRTPDTGIRPQAHRHHGSRWASICSVLPGRSSR